MPLYKNTSSQQSEGSAEHAHSKSSQYQVFYALLTTAIVAYGGYTADHFMKMKYDMSYRAKHNAQQGSINLPDWDSAEVARAGVMFALEGLSKSSANFRVHNTVSPEARSVLEICTQRKNISGVCRDVGLKLLD